MGWSLNRVVMTRSRKAWINELTPAGLEAAEISGEWGKLFNFKDFESFRYPKTDICKGPVQDDQGRVRKFDIVLANQVWEHQDHPGAATRNIYKMLKKTVGSGWRCRFSSPSTPRPMIAAAGPRGACAIC